MNWHDLLIGLLCCALAVAWAALAICRRRIKDLRHSLRIFAGRGLSLMSVPWLNDNTDWYLLPEYADCPDCGEPRAQSVCTSDACTAKRQEEEQAYIAERTASCRGCGCSSDGKGGAFWSINSDYLWLCAACCEKYIDRWGSIDVVVGAPGSVEMADAGH